MSKFGNELIEAMKEALSHARGRKRLKIHRISTKPVDIKAVRAKLRLTQYEMAALLHVSASGYRKWEQGVRQPQGAARTLLKVMAREPQSVLRALAPERAA
jgi:putative transcriptional regulator